MLFSCWEILNRLYWIILIVKITCTGKKDYGDNRRLLVKGIIWQVEVGQGFIQLSWQFVNSLKEVT